MDTVTELLTYTCESCGGKKWDINIGYRSDGKTFLIIVCGNKECVENRRKELDIDEDSLVVWSEFDITGQGCDPLDHYEPEVIN